MARNKFDIDESLDQEFDYSQVKRITAYMRPYLKDLVTALLVMVIASALSLLAPLFLMYVIRDFIPQKNVNGIIGVSVLYTAIVIISAFLLGVRAKITNRVGQSIIHDIRLDMFKHLQELSFSYFDDRPHGKILVRIVNYVNNISDLLSNGVVNVIVDMISLLIIVIYMLILSPILTLYAMAGIPVLLIGMFVIKGFQRRAQQLVSAKMSNINAYTQESLSGMKVTQAFAREDVNSEILHELSCDFRYSWMKSSMLNIAMWPYVELVTNGTIALLYAAGALWIASEQGVMIEVGIVIAFVGYVWRFWGPINTMSGFYSQLINSAAYIERIFEFLDEPVEIENLDGASDLPPINGYVEFENVTFSYDEEIYVLEDVSFIAKPGDSIALVGPTGGGKSTIVNLLIRFYDIQGGKIKIDGHDIKYATLESLRSQMGIMLQDPFLFPGPIIENIRYGKLDATDEECIQAAKSVCAHDFIEALPDGYDTEISEQGGGVSAGEKQLISFARVLLSDPKILILDEATASIDTKTEMALQKGLDELLRGRTSFIIAHRLSTIRKVTRIMAIGNKKIIESGTHDELIAHKGLYYELYQSQFASMK